MVDLKQRVSVLGLGYIGLPLSAALANAGYKVIAVDNDSKKIEDLKRGVVYLYEPGLRETLASQKDNIEFITDDKYAIGNSDIIFVAVGTPLKDNLDPDYSQLNSCLKSIGENLRKGQLIFLKSTLFLGTTEFYALPMLEMLSGLKGGEDFYLAFCPERTSEGQVMHEIHVLPKIVAGINKESSDRAVKVMKKLGGQITTVSTPRIAEMCKLLDNLYRATSIAFANEVAEVCEKAGLNAEEVISTVNKGYLRTKIYKHGLGADGPCLTKDPEIYRYSAALYNAKTPLTDGSIEQNKKSTANLISLIKDFSLQNYGTPLNIAVMGPAFKGMPETDDTRYSTAEKIIAGLKLNNVKINSLRAFDPRAETFLGEPVKKSITEAIENANVIMFLTNHPKLMNIDFEHIKDKISNPSLIIDAWGNLNVEKIPEGMKYHRIGHGQPIPKEKDPAVLSYKIMDWRADSEYDSNFKI
ncbi:MAG: nucleotide sugar dehydrogenase [Candidatus Pacearchaeota archaeon]|nr:nucleotide sugar dehydrogenase [Candidatus Pacearchaeota archaeon]